MKETARDIIDSMNTDVVSIRQKFSMLLNTRGFSFEQRKKCDQAENGFLWWQRTEFAEFLKAFKDENHVPSTVEGSDGSAKTGL